MSLRNVATVYRKELTEALRDRRTLVTTFLVPLLMIPLMSAGFLGVMSMVLGKAKREKPKVMILGGEDSPGVVASLKGFSKITALPAAADWKERIVAKKIRAAVEIPPGFQANLGQHRAGTVKIYFYRGELKSLFAAANIEAYLKEYSDDVVTERLAAK